MFGKKKGVDFAGLPPEVRIQFEALKSGIFLSGKKRPAKSLLFSSYHHGEGTSTVAAHFAECLAQDQKNKVLLVDANTRTPGLPTPPGAQASGETFSFPDMFSGKAERWTLPKPSADTANLSVVSGGNGSSHPSQVFDHDRFSLFIKSAGKIFNFLIFDSSPVGQYYDSIVLGAHMDGVILVAEAERTRSHELNRAKQMLQDANVRIIGVVMNKRKFHIPSFIFGAVFK